MPGLRVAAVCIGAACVILGLTVGFAHEIATRLRE